jgi:hypothetical protein
MGGKAAGRRTILVDDENVGGLLMAANRSFSFDIFGAVSVVVQMVFGDREHQGDMRAQVQVLQLEAGKFEHDAVVGAQLVEECDGRSADIATAEDAGCVGCQ